MITKGFPRLKAVLKLPESAVGILNFVRALRAVLVANPKMFPSLPLPLSELDADIAALDKTQAAMHMRGAGTTGRRNAALIIIISDLGLLCAYVQRLMDLDPPNALKIATTALMSVIGPRAKTKTEFEVKRVKGISGAVDLLARKKAAKETHFFEHSVDGVTWIALPPRLQAKVRVKGLTPGTVVWGRHRSVLKGGMTEYCDPQSIIVL